MYVHVDKNLHIDVDSTSPRVYVRSPFRKSHLGVGIYNTSITDISANHSEMAPFAVTYGIMIYIVVCLLNDI